ncbi:MAG TPA: PD-(D/E)XK nuclease family protein [Acidimicrobiales bacterium]|nr:PD-(D/E)XK nuclease family protein [Acidimicrobiales bacterium]
MAVTGEVYNQGVPITGHPTAYGRAAATLLAGQVAALKGGDPLAPVTVVVASNYAAVAARRALAERPGGIANVSLLTLHRLAERLGAPSLAAAGRRPVPVPVIGAAVRSVLHDDPGLFASVADHPATEAALVAAHRELAAVPDHSLDRVAACSPRAGDVVRIHRAVRARLADAWYDEHDLLVAAAGVWAGRPADHTSDPVIVHLLEDIPPAGAELLRFVGPDHVNVGLTGDPDADDGVLAAHRRAGIEVEPPALERPCAGRIVSASDPDDEVRAAVRLVTRWAHEGITLGRMALVYPLADPYARLLHEQLGAAGIPWNGAPVRQVGDLLFGRTLRALLALPDRGYRRPDVLAALTEAPLLDGDHRVPGRAWERLSRRAGVVGGDDWDERLAHLSSRLRHQAEAIEAEEDCWLAQRNRRDAADADALSSFVGRLRADLDSGATAGSWADMVAWAQGLIATYLGDDRYRVGWPDEERLAAERVEAALDRLAGLDVLEGPPPTVEVFRRTLDAELEAAGRRVGRLGAGVLVGPVSVTAGLVLERVVVLGLAEGVFPPRRLEDSLLPDTERAAAGGALALRADRIHVDRRHLLSAVASADQAVLGQPRGDLRRSRERPASRWLVADAARLSGVADLRSGDLAAHAADPWLDLVPSFAGGLRALGAPVSGQELRLAAAARRQDDHAALTTDARLVAALEVVRARRSRRFTRFDGNLSAVAAELGPPPTASATRLQRWAACPQRYLLQHVLGVEPVEEPERLLAISALDKGSAIHEILDEFVGTAIGSGHPLDGWTGADRVRLQGIADTCLTRYQAQGRTGRALFWRRDRAQMLNDLERFLERDGARLAEGYRPLRTEHPFHDVVVTLPGGHQLAVAGKVDRIDRAPDGTLAVLDYKTGGVSSYRGLSEEDPHGGGRWLQLVLYALAAEANFGTDRPVWSGYWFITAKGNFKMQGYPVTAGVAARVLDAIDSIVAGIAEGIFPAHPGEPTSRVGYVDCWACSPDGLSAADRRREWEHKRGDPVLAAYVVLAEPETVGAGS